LRWIADSKALRKADSVALRVLRRWLRDRALRLPSDRVREIAQRLGVKEETVRDINDAIIDWILGEA
jgi:hypothetical protein